MNIEVTLAEISLLAAVRDGQEVFIRDGVAEVIKESGVDEIPLLQQGGES